MSDAYRASFNSVSIPLFQSIQSCPTNENFPYRFSLTFPRLSQVEALIEHVRASEVTRLQRAAIQVRSSVHLL